MPTREVCEADAAGACAFGVSAPLATPDWVATAGAAASSATFFDAVLVALVGVDGAAWFELVRLTALAPSGGSEVWRKEAIRERFGEKGATTAAAFGVVADAAAATDRGVDAPRTRSGVEG